MKKGSERISIEQFGDMINVLNPCMDDYLYVLDLQNDFYCISENATVRFNIPQNEFSNAVEVFKDFVYPEDFEA